MLCPVPDHGRAPPLASTAQLSPSTNAPASEATQPVRCVRTAQHCELRGRRNSDETGLRLMLGSDEVTRNALSGDPGDRGAHAKALRRENPRAGQEGKNTGHEAARGRTRDRRGLPVSRHRVQASEGGSWPAAGEGGAGRADRQHAGAAGSPRSCEAGRALSYRALLRCAPQTVTRVREAVRTNMPTALSVKETVTNQSPSG